MKKHFIFLLLAHSLVLGACTTAAPHGPAITAQMLLEDRRTREVILTDREIEADAYSELSSNNTIHNQCHVTINAYNGAVLVTGEAPTEKLGKKIIAAVQTVANVKLVHNNLIIGHPIDAAARANDIAITDSVKKALEQIRTLPDFSPAMIKVITEDGTVYLMGWVHRDEGAVVINVTRLQPGIKQIITVFEYID
jgi:osmotically-inducible protein OsmY